MPTPLKGLLQRLIARFHLAGVIWKAHPQQIEHFREWAARKPRIGDQPDLQCLASIFSLQHVGELLSGEHKQGHIKALFCGFQLLCQQVEPVIAVPPGMG